MDHKQSKWKSRKDQGTTLVKTDRLTSIANLLKEGENADDGQVKELPESIQSAISMQEDRNGKEEHEAITLHDTIRTFKSSGLDQNDLVTADFKTTALMERPKRQCNNHYRYEGPPYGRRFSKYRNNRYRQTDEEQKTQEGLRNGAQEDLRN